MMFQRKKLFPKEKSSYGVLREGKYKILGDLSKLFLNSVKLQLHK